MDTLAADLTAPLRSFTLDVSLRLGPETLALVGPSGAGKTTVLRAIAGLHRPRQGSISLGGETWFDSERGVDRAPEQRSVGLVFQEYALFPHMSVRSNVAFGGGRDGEVTDLLERLGVGHLAAERPAALSGGERQRVALARALARAPGALMLDEPLSALDPGTRAAAGWELRRHLREAGVPVIVVTHDFMEAASLADRLAVIDAGRIVQQGTAADLAARPESGFVADLAGASLLAGAASPGHHGLTEVLLDGGAVVTSTDAMRGRVGVAIYPWEVAVEAGSPGPGSSQINHLQGTVASLTVLGNRARVAISTPQRVVAEVTTASVERLGLREGSPAVASWKATATRLVPLAPGDQPPASRSRQK